MGQMEEKDFLVSQIWGKVVQNKTDSKVEAFYTGYQASKADRRGEFSGISSGMRAW